MARPKKYASGRRGTKTRREVLDERRPEAEQAAQDEAQMWRERMIASGYATRGQSPTETAFRLIPRAQPSSGYEKERRGLFTGQPLQMRKEGPGRKKEYVSADARRAASRVAEINRLVCDLALDPGFSIEAEKRLRGDLYAIGNCLNRNVDPEARAAKKTKAKASAAKRRATMAKRKNPAEQIHRTAGHGQAGEPLAACGFRDRSVWLDTPNGPQWRGELATAWHAELVTCAACQAASEPRGRRG